MSQRQKQENAVGLMAMKEALGIFRNYFHGNLVLESDLANAVGGIDQ